jgi:hypothetical protein
VPPNAPVVFIFSTRGIGEHRSDEQQRPLLPPRMTSRGVSGRPCKWPVDSAQEKIRVCQVPVSNFLESEEDA